MLESQHSVIARALCTASVLVFTALVSAPASAQQADAGADATINEIIVTATKRAEDISKVPAAISVLGGDNLRTLGVNSVSDIQNVSPGVQVGRDAFGVNINIRGVTTTDQTSKGAQGIAFNVDGIFVGRPSIQGLSFFDVERVEVLRGPQGTLYGQSSTGGAINVITRKPELGVLGGNAWIEIGNYDTKRAEAAINVPLGDTVAVRVAGNFNQRDGFLKPVSGDSADGFYESAVGKHALNDQDDVSGRAALLFKPSDAFSARITLTAGHVGGFGPGQALIDQLNAGGSHKLDIVANPIPSKMDENYINVDGELNLDLGPVTATYVGGHHYFKSNDVRVGSNNPLANNGGAYIWVNYRGNVTEDSHELRFANTNPGFIDYVIGANWLRENINESDHNWYAPLSSPTIADSYNGIDPVNNTRHTSYGFFGQATVHVTDRLGVVAGLRYSNDETRRVGTFAPGPGPWPNASGGTCVAPEDCIGFANNGYQKAGKVTWRGGINFQATPTDLVYASVASGYKPGGFNDFDPVLGAAAGPQPYQPEQLVAYEVGYKGRPLNGVRFNSDFYYYDYSKAQISSLVNVGGSFVIYTRSVPETIYGWENELTFDLSPRTSIALTGAFAHSEYKSFMAGLLQDVDWSGQRLDKTPKFSGSIAINHAVPLANDAELRLRWFTKVSSSYYVSDFVDAVHLTQRAFTRSDASITYAAAKDAWSIQAFVENVENKVQYISAPTTYAPTVTNGSAIAISTPRFYGVRLGVNF